jgi:hypothetical protein
LFVIERLQDMRFVLSIYFGNCGHGLARLLVI